MKLEKRSLEERVDLLIMDVALLKVLTKKLVDHIHEIDSQVDPYPRYTYKPEFALSGEVR